MIRASDLNEAVDASDPVAAAWRRDVALRDPSAALLCRRWLDRDVGEAQCAVAGSLLGGSASSRMWKCAEPCAGSTP